MTDEQGRQQADRRAVLKLLAGLGVGTAAFQRAVAQQAIAGTISSTDIQGAEWVAGIEISAADRAQVLDSLQGLQHERRQLRAVQIDYGDLPALRFDPAMYETAATRVDRRPPWLTTEVHRAERSKTDPESLSFRSIAELGQMLRSGAVTAVALAQHCLTQLQTIDPVLHCVVTLTPDLAFEQAERADQELAAGKDRGPLHGIPWGAKDLIAVPGYPTTWGAPQFRDRELPETATIARKLADAGGVLVGKLSMGALAMGDKWFGGQTRSPWNPKRGSSGSSAGSAAAVAAGAVPFAIGTETLGSIVSPAKRCGVTGLRPTFGRVSRRGCMSLAWSMDKPGPIARTADDCGIVLAMIHGADDGDPVTVDRWFAWPVTIDLSQVRIGRVTNRPRNAADVALASVLKRLGAQMVDIELPEQFPEWAISMMLDVEAATMFHDLIARNDTEGLNRWPTVFRKAHFLSAVDYLHAARVRGRLMQAMNVVFESVDAYVGGDDLGISNLTGHPSLVLPTVMSSGSHTQPLCATLTGRLYDEATLLAIGRLVESEVNINRREPPPLESPM